MISKKILVKLILFVSVLSGIFFVINSERISKTEIWYTNVDQDSSLLIETMLVNSGHPATFVEHPGLGVYLVYGFGLKLQKAMNLISVSNFDDYFKNEDPLLLLPGLYGAMRHWSILLVLAISLMAGISIFIISNSIVAASVAFTILTSSSGFLIQSLMARTELTTIFFVTICFLFLTMWAKKNDSHKFNSTRSLVLLALAGLSMGLAMLSKMVVLPLLMPILMLLFGRLIVARQDINSNPNLFKFEIIQTFGVGLVLGVTTYYFKYGIVPGALSDSKIPLLLVLFWIIWAAALVVGRKLILPSLIVHSVLVFTMGLLLCVPIMFWYCSLYDLWHCKNIINAVFTTGMARTGGYANSVSLGYGAIYYELSKFIYYITLTSGLFIVALLTTFFARPQERMLSVMLTTCGLGMCIVMSMRYFGLHYLVFSDFFFSLAIAVNAGSMLTKLRISKLLDLNKVGPAIGLIVLLLFFHIRQLDYVKRVYPSYNLPVRNDMAYVTAGVGSTILFKDRMLAHYHSQSEVVKRLIYDNRLNGSSDGIKILDKPNIKEHIAGLSSKKL